MNLEIKMDTQKYEIQSLEVCKARAGVFSVSSDDLRLLKERAKASKLHRSRICCHGLNEDLVHEMIIAMTNEVRIQPHRHLDKEESFHVVEGDLTVILFDKAGGITNTIELGEYRLGKNCYYRLPKNIFHTVVVRSEIAVIHEVTNGPFIEGQSENADFNFCFPDNSRDIGSSLKMY